MTRQSTTDVAHTANTDHRILRRPGQVGEGVLGFQTGSSWLLKPFGSLRAETADRQAARDLGIALTQAAGRGLLRPKHAAGQALILFEHGLAEDDCDAWEAKGWASLLQDKAAAARTAFDKVLSREPRREVALSGAADAAEFGKQFDASIDVPALRCIC